MFVDRPRQSRESVARSLQGPEGANGVLPNFLVENSLLLRICIFFMGAPLSRVFAYQTNESTPLLRVR